MRRGSLSPQYKLERNARWHELYFDNGLTFNEIASSELYNPDKVSPQRIHKVVHAHNLRLEKM